MLFRLFISKNSHFQPRTKCHQCIDHHLRDRIGSSYTAFVRAADLLSVIYTIRGCMLSLKYSASCMTTIDSVDCSCPQILYRVNDNSLQPGISGTMTQPRHPEHQPLFFADISRGMSLFALRQPAEWSWSQNRIHVRQRIGWWKCQSRVDILTLPCIDKLWVLKSMWNASGTINDWGRSLLKLPGRSDGLCLVCNIHATPVLTRDRAHVKSVTPSTFIDASSCRSMTASSSKIVNLSFLPEISNSKPPEATWKLENIIDNR